MIQTESQTQAEMPPEKKESRAKSLIKQVVMIAAAAGDRVSAQKHLQTALNFNSRFHPLLAAAAVKTMDGLANATPVTAKDASADTPSN